MQSLKKIFILTSAFAGTALFPLAACAQDLSQSISCLHGAVPASDYAELGQKLRETAWDQRGGVALTSSIGNVALRVTNPTGQNVCQETANNSTSCTFKVGTTSAVEEFTITIDNIANAQEITYKVCAY